MAALMSSLANNRLKIWPVVLVPAPEDPVTAITGWRLDINGKAPGSGQAVEQPRLLYHKALSIVHTQLSQQVQHAPGLHLRGNHLPLHVVGHVDYGLHHGLVSLAGHQLAGEGAVDLDQIHRQRTHELERAGAATEVTQAEPATQLLHFRHEVDHRLQDRKSVV